MKNRIYHGVILVAGLFVMLAIAGTSSVQAQISIVVANSSTHTANGSELKQIFSGTKLHWSDGQRIAVVQLSENTTAKPFYENFIGMSLNQVRNDWSRLVLTGQATSPKQCSNDEAVKKVVAGDENAVGFIASSALDSSVKEIYRVITFSRGK